MTKDRILVYPCGSEIGLEILRAFRGLVTVEIWGASAIDDHGLYVYENYIHGVPMINAPNFIDLLNQAIDTNGIGYIIATHEDVGVFLIEHAAEINATIISPPAETVKVMRSKRQTYKALEGKVMLPVQYTAQNVTESSFPLFLKPDALQGGQGTAIVKNTDELKKALEVDPHLLILEYLPGEEVSVDCYTNCSGELKFVGARKRARVRNGISVNTLPVYDKAINVAAAAINDVFDLRGAWFFQMKKDKEGVYRLLEAAPRIASSMALYRNLGVNFPQLAYYSAKGIDCDLLLLDHNIVMDRALGNKFKIDLEYNEIYFDFDDCIYLDNGKLDLLLMSLVIKARNEGVKTTLLTKHRGDLPKLLAELGIAQLFNEVIHIDMEQKKSDFINNKCAIFIDNSYKERHDVFTLKNIPVFAPDAVESLL